MLVLIFFFLQIKLLIKLELTLTVINVFVYMFDVKIIKCTLNFEDKKIFINNKQITKNSIVTKVKEGESFIKKHDLVGNFLKNIPFNIFLIVSGDFDIYKMTIFNKLCSLLPFPIKISLINEHIARSQFSIFSAFTFFSIIKALFPHTTKKR